MQILNDNLIKLGKNPFQPATDGVNGLLGALDAYGNGTEEVDDTTTDFSGNSETAGAQIGNIWANSFNKSPTPRTS